MIDANLVYSIKESEENGGIAAEGDTGLFHGSDVEKRGGGVGAHSAIELGTREELQQRKEALCLAEFDAALL